MQMKKTLCPVEPTVTGRSGSIAKDIFRKKLPIPGTIGIGSLKKKGDEIPDCTAIGISAQAGVFAYDPSLPGKIRHGSHILNGDDVIRL